MASDDQMWQPPTIGLATAGIAKPMITANGQMPVAEWPRYSIAGKSCDCAVWYVGNFPRPCPVHSQIGYISPLKTAPPLSDADVERIARRVAELLKAAP